MTLRRLARAALIVGCAAFLAEGPVGVASGQPRIVALAGAVAGESAAHVGNLELVGVVVAGDRSLALFRDGAARGGASEMVRLGGLAAGHRVIDILVDRVIVETPRGERVTVRLAAGSGEIQLPPQASETTEVITETPRSRRSERRRERARLAAERAAAGLPVDPAADVME